MKLLLTIFIAWLSFTIGRGYDTEAPAKVSIALATEQAQYLITKGTSLVSELSK